MFNAAFSFVICKMEKKEEKKKKKKKKKKKGKARIISRFYIKKKLIQVMPYMLYSFLFVLFLSCICVCLSFLANKNVY